MPLASEVAAELRKLAECFDTNPDAKIVAPHVYFSHAYQGEAAKLSFFALAKLLPRPLKKSDGFNHDEIVLGYESDAIAIRSSIPKSETCELIAPAQPAKYRCVPILSPEEDAAMEAL